MKTTKDGSCSLIKEHSVRRLAHSAPVNDQGEITTKSFAVTRGFLDALNNLTLDLLGHCLGVAASENRRTLMASDIPTFTELMGSELEELEKSNEGEGEE